MLVELMKTKRIGTPTIMAIIFIIAIAGIGGYLVLNGGEEIREGEGVEEGWHSVANFSGRSSEITTPFDISGDRFRVRWSYTAEPEDLGWLLFNIRVYPWSENFENITYGEFYDYARRYQYPHVGEVMREDFPISDSGTVYIYKGKRSYFLEVSALDLTNWTINVEEW